MVQARHVLAALLLVAVSSADDECVGLCLEERMNGWKDKTADALFEQYDYIFPNGNRNAASHLWATFVLDRATQMTAEKLEYFFYSFCPVSGSPVQPGSADQTWLYSGANALADVSGAAQSGTMAHCCWPCVCDSLDWLTVDTKTITTSDGDHEFKFVVIGNPCEKAGLDPSLIPVEAPDVTCTGSTLDRATLSDGGHIIIGMLHMSATEGQDPATVQPQCQERESMGYQSGMGQIFIDVARINPIPGSHSGTVVVNTDVPDLVGLEEQSQRQDSAHPPHNSARSAELQVWASSSVCAASVALTLALAAAALRTRAQKGGSGGEAIALRPGAGSSMLVSGV